MGWSKNVTSQTARRCLIVLPCNGERKFFGTAAQPLGREELTSSRAFPVPVSVVIDFHPRKPLLRHFGLFTARDPKRSENAIAAPRWIGFWPFLEQPKLPGSRLCNDVIYSSSCLRLQTNLEKWKTSPQEPFIVTDCRNQSFRGNRGSSQTFKIGLGFQQFLESHLLFKKCFRPGSEVSCWRAGAASSATPPGFSAHSGRSAHNSIAGQLRKRKFTYA
jgi:hypothetical protein